MIDDIADKEAADQILRLHGRASALEILLQLQVMYFAQTQPNPFQWIQNYLETVRAAGKSMMPEINHPSAPRQMRETVTALDEFLEGLVRDAGQLKGSPSNPL